MSNYDDYMLDILDRDIDSNTNSNFKQKIIWASKQFGKHFVKQFKPREILKSVKTHPYLLASFVLFSIIGIVLLEKGIPYESCKNVYSIWTLVVVVHLIQAASGLCLPGETRLKRFFKIPFHLFLATLSFLYWLKMGEWMHFGYHHFLYANFLLFYTFERLGKSGAIVIGFPLAISDIVGYGEFPIFPKPTSSSGLDDILKNQPWIFLVPTCILFVCELLIQGPLIQTLSDLKHKNTMDVTEYSEL